MWSKGFLYALIYQGTVSQGEAKVTSVAKVKMETELAFGETHGHQFKNIGSGTSDEPACSCGWKGKVMWDDTFDIHDQWFTHVQLNASGGQMHLPLYIVAA